ncbi:hypothetical protein ACWGIU_03900 [Streptomyces sp. NPDC054840]
MSRSPPAAAGSPLHRLPRAYADRLKGWADWQGVAVEVQGTKSA